MSRPLKAGISQIGVAIPRHFISLEELAETRKIPLEYVLSGLGVFQARIPYEKDIEDLAIEAIKKIDYQDVQRFYVGTESDPDLSKPLSVKILNQKLGLKIIPFQYKFACLSGLQALISACEYSAANQGKPAIALSVDRSIYQETEPAAEITQGCAAVAIRVEVNPKILILDYQNFGEFAADIDDFQVPGPSFPFPEVNGELTKSSYLACQKQALENWQKKNQEFLKKLPKKLIIDALDFFITHTPFPKMVEWIAAVFWRHGKLKEKPHLTLDQCIENPRLFKEYKRDLDKIRERPEFQKFFEKKVRPGLKYNPYIGNSYTCSVFISLISILENIKKAQEIGISGYGSGAGSICIRGTSVTNGFKTDLENQLKNGEKLSLKEYQKWRTKQTYVYKRSGDDKI